ncbi:MAG: nuclear transport factor 2 family protein [Gemmobacter sp.]|nr:nuclear transport factor 2 family protein [Gemmobacter sp.]
MSQPDKTTEDVAIRAVLTDYFDGLYHGRMDQFASAFHPEARLFAVVEGKVSAIDYAPYMERCAGRAAPAASGADQVAEVLSLTLTSADTAHARVRDAFPPRTYVNDLCLVKAGGKWGIVSKVYHAEP